MSESRRQPGPNEVTRLLEEWTRGDKTAFKGVIELLCPELMRQARLRMRGERRGATLETRWLVNEAYIRLERWVPTELKNRGQFIATAVGIMKNILVDNARKHKLQKRKLGLELTDPEKRALPAEVDESADA